MRISADVVGVGTHGLPRPTLGLADSRAASSAPPKLGGLRLIVLLWAGGVHGQDATPAVGREEEAPPRPAPVAMPAPASIQQAIDRGIQFLLTDQNPDGSWGSAERTKDLNIFAPVPGAHHAFRTAVTSLCISAPD